MDEAALRGLITEVKGGRLSRRAFIRAMAALGVTVLDEAAFRALLGL